MHKNFALARAEALDSLQNRAEIAIWVFLELLPIFVMGSLFISNSTHPTQPVTYYFSILITSRLTSFYFHETLQNEIRDGSFSRFLLKPVSLPFFYIPQNLGGKAVNGLTILLPLILALGLSLGKYLTLPTPVNFWLFLLSLILAFFIQFSLAVIVSVFGFYLEQAFAMVHLKWVLDSIFGGYMLPLQLYPSWLQATANLLPFKYQFYLPAAVFSNSLPVSETVSQLTLGLLWCIGLFITGQLFWRKGITKYQSVGG